MIAFTVIRLLPALLAAITVSIITFLLLWANGDAAAELAGEDAAVEDIADIRRLYGLERPLHIQNFEWAAEHPRAGWHRLGLQRFYATSRLWCLRVHRTVILGLC
ncbi:MAG: hypothetical protein O7C61_01880 [SAR324 cluster bacterium]|nr:hypothetical protein [SAR324 cluster bacterium]